MSEQVRIKGTINQVHKLFINNTLEDLCKRELEVQNDYEDVIIPNEFKTAEEYLIYKYHDKYLVRNGILYKFEFCNLDNTDEFFESEFVNSAGGMKFHASYHNGGCSLHEAINECIDNVK